MSQCQQGTELGTGLPYSTARGRTGGLGLNEAPGPQGRGCWVRSSMSMVRAVKAYGYTQDLDSLRCLLQSES